MYTTIRSSIWTDKAAAIEAETRLAIAKIRAAARDKLLAELAPEATQESGRVAWTTL